MPKHTDQSTYAGPLSKPVQVNFTEKQKALLVKRCREAGVALSVYIRMAAVEKGLMRPKAERPTMRRTKKRESC